MRIISRHHDYYDSALAHGADMTLVYERSTRTLDGRGDPLGEALDVLSAPRREGHSVFHKGRYHPQERYLPGVLLFCGRAFPFYEHDHYERPVDGRTRTVHWGLDTVEAAVEASGQRGRWEASYEGYAHRSFSRAHVQGFFEAPTPEGPAADAHARHGTPVILYRRLRDERKVQTVLDPVLRDLGFYRLRDSFTAFQEIAMYLGGVLRAGERPMVEIPDQVRAEKHGMDKTSFRRPPRQA
jgi:hypothetical protein